MGGRGLWLNSDEVRLLKDSPNLLLYGKRLNNLETLEPIGMLIISIDRRVFDEMFKNISNAEKGDLMILEQNKIIYSNSHNNDLKKFLKRIWIRSMICLSEGTASKRWMENGMSSPSKRIR